MRLAGASAGRRALIAAVSVAGYAAVLVANLPGHFSPDSLWQLAQGRSGVFDDWHPPVMAALLGLADRLIAGAPLFIVVNGALFFAGLWAFAALERRPRLIVFPLLALVMASPLVLIYQGIVWKDVLFANAAMAGFAALAWAGRMWSAPVRRFVLIAIAVALFTLATLARQNGWIVAVGGAAALGAVSARRGGAFSALAWGGGGLAVIALAAGLASYGLAMRGDGVPQTLRQLKRLEVLDLAGAVRRDPSLDLSVLRQQAPALEAFIRREAAPAYTAAGADNLGRLADGPAMAIPAGDAVTHQWRGFVLSRPGLYLRIRGEVFFATFMASTANACPTQFAGVDSGNPGLLKRAGLAARFDDKDAWDDAYEYAFLGTPVFSHLLYAAILMAVLAVSLRRFRRGERRPERLCVIAMGASAFAFTASFFFISSACDYRYLYFLDVAAMAALLFEAAARSDPHP